MAAGARVASAAIQRGSRALSLGTRMMMMLLVEGMKVSYPHAVDEAVGKGLRTGT